MTHLERALVIVGLTCLGFYGLSVADAAYQEKRARVLVERALETRQVNLREVPPRKIPASTAAARSRTDGVAASNSVVEVAPAASPPRDVVGLLQIPRLNFSTPVLAGDDAATLRGAAGHLPDTPRPWEEGNSAIAAHRDGIFRPLRNIKVGDELHLRTPRGDLRYRVSDTHIVKPSDLSVLEAKRPHMLTLITCYPFNYVGAAPQRFVVHAEKVFE